MPLLITVLSLLLASTTGIQGRKQSPPHIVYILMDDVGHADLSYSNPEGPIPTPLLDRLSKQGVRLDSHYAHPTCTPSRAALMTGRYSANVGLTFAMLPGSPAGLSTDFPTLPQVLRREGYAAHMVGKWHLGSSKWAQTPVGRGFETHVGMMLWDIDSYSKQMYREPYTPMSIDWMRSNEARNYSHFLDPRHATIALTAEAEAVITKHATEQDEEERRSSNEKDPAEEKPLFLYLAYAAAHSPLQPLPRHAAKCEHIPHLWRRQYCGMVVGLDEAISNITSHAQATLGDNLLVVVASDNGATTWWGGLNYPLRSGKYSAFEGGTRVPAFAVDYTPGGRYLGGKGQQGEKSEGRVFKGLFHMSDWLPTLVSAATGLSGDALTAHLPQGLDGVDQLGGLRKCGTGEEEGKYERRGDLLLDLYDANETIYNGSAVVYRQGKYKLMEGVFRDSHWYYEPTSDWMNSTDATWVATVGELVLRSLEWVFGEGPFDTSRTALVSNVFHKRYQDSGLGTGTFLFDVEADQEEKHNLASDLPLVVEQLRAAADVIRENRPMQQQYWMTIDLEEEYIKSFVPGDCSADPSFDGSQYCRFVHPFLSDEVDAWDPAQVTLIDGALYAKTKLKIIVKKALVAGIAVVVACYCWRRDVEKQAGKSNKT